MGSELLHGWAKNSSNKVVATAMADQTAKKKK
jgi:hypothetical protein